MIFHSTQPINEYLKTWITRQHNPTWEGMVDFIREFGAPDIALKIEAIVPTATPPASKQTTFKKKY